MASRPETRAEQFILRVMDSRPAGAISTHALLREAAAAWEEEAGRYSDNALRTALHRLIGQGVLVEETGLIERGVGTYIRRP